MALLTPPRILGAAAVLLLVNSQLPVRFGGLAGAVLRPVADTVVLPLREPVFRIARRLNRPDATPDTGELSDPGAATRDQLAGAYDRLLVELGRLRQRNAELQRKIFIAQGYKEEDLPPRRRVVATVTTYTHTGTRHVVSISRGRNQGLAAGQTVLYGHNLVGRVVEPVGPVSADVELVTGQDVGFHVELTAATDTDDATPDRPAGAPLPGLEHLRVTPDPDAGTFTTEVRHDTAPPVGALARLADEIHFRDARAHVLGRVTEVRPYPDDPQLLLQVVIRPTLDLRFLSEVVVLVPEESPKSEVRSSK